MLSATAPARVCCGCLSKSFERRALRNYRLGCTPLSARRGGKATPQSAECRPSINRCYRYLVGGQRGRALIAASSGSNGGNGSDNTQPARWKLIGSLVAVATIAALILTYASDGVQDMMYGDGLDVDTSDGISAGDLLGASLWGTSLYFCNPLQLLLLFIGDINTERPSDWLLRLLGASTGQRVDSADYVAPIALKAVVVALCGGTGAGIAWAFGAGLGDATWSVSTGLGACVAAAVYEVGRPQRFSPEEASQLDDQWQAFAAFAGERLQRSGGCHEREVAAAFRRSDARFQNEDLMSDGRVRDFVKNWHPDARITPNGFWKGVSLRARTDPFTGTTVGTPASKAPKDSSVPSI